jgi:small-conductance mechanosensitive channel
VSSLRPAQPFRPLCLCLLLAPLLLPPAAGWAQGASGKPAAESAPAETPPLPKVEPIPVAEISARAGQARTQLGEIEKGLAPSESAARVVAGLPGLAERVRAQSAKAAEIIANPSIPRLDQLRLEWTAIQRESDALQSSLRARAADLERQLDRVAKQRERWQATRAAAVAAETPEEVFAQIAEVDAAVARVTEQAKARQGAIVTLQSRVAELSETIKAELRELAQTRDGIVGDVFRADSPPIWDRGFFEPIGTGEVWERLVESQAREVELVKAYVSQRRTALILHLVLLAALATALIAIRARVRARAEHDEDLAAVRAVFDRPVSMALLLTVLASIWTLPGMPQGMRQPLGALLILPAVLILRRLLEPAIFPILNALFVLWVFERARVVLAPLPHAPRLLFMAEMLGLVALLAWWMRPARLRAITPEAARQPFFRVTGVAVRIAFAVCSAALIAEVVGYTALGELVGGSALFAAYAGVVLYGAVRVVDAIVAFLLRVRPLRLLGMVQRHRSLIRRRSVQAVRLGATLWWTVEVLGRLEIADNLWGGLVAVVSAEAEYGNLAISIGDLLAFGIAVWAAFKVSSFIRFFLEEDVYPRAQLRKGQPYAVSTLVHYTILTLGFLIAVSMLGFDLDRFALVAGAFSVGIGFGLQNIVNNFVSGLILLTERPVEVGDTVSIGAAAEVFGEVQRIGIRSSTVRTWQGAEVIVPNGDLVSGQVTNWTHTDRRRRLEIPVGVAYGSDPQKVMAVLLEVAKADEHLLVDPEPYVLFMGFGESSLDFELRGWTVEFDSFLRVRSGLCTAIEAALRAEGITIPFPQRDLHVRTVAVAAMPAEAPVPPPRRDAAPESES